jgi:hypothetical protein
MGAIMCISGAKGTGSTAALTTIYGNMCNGNVQATGTATTESNAQVPFRIAGTLSYLYCRMVTNDRSTSTFKVRKNGADGNCAISITGSTTGEFIDSTHTDSVASGDLLNYQFVTGSGGSTTAIRLMSVLFTTSGSTIMTKIGGLSSSGNISSASTSYYQNPSAFPTNLNPAEAGYKVKVKGSFTWQSLYAYVTTYTRGTASVFRNRINGANGTMALSMAGTGSFEDTTHTDALVNGDLISLTVDNGTGGGDIVLINYATELVTSGTGNHILSGNTSVNVSVGATVYPVIGALNSSSTESDSQLDPRSTTTLSNLETTITANGFTSTSTFRTRKNGSNGGQSISITAGTTGYLEDTSGSDSLVSGDHANLQIVGGGTASSNLTLAYLATLSTPAAPPPPSGFIPRRFIGK